MAAWHWMLILILVADVVALGVTMLAWLKLRREMGMRAIPGERSRETMVRHRKERKR
jgi:hypothetical protein